MRILTHCICTLVALSTFVAPVSAATNSRVYVLEPGATLPSEVAELAVVRDLPGLRLAILPGTTQSVVVPGMTEVSAEGENMLFLVDLQHQGGLDAIAQEGEVVRVAGDLALVEVSGDRTRQFGRLRVCKERLTWLPRLRRAENGPETRSLSRVSTQTKQDIVNAVAETRLSQIYRELSGNLVFWLNGVLQSNDNRYTHTAGSGAGIDIAANYLEDRFQAAGYPVIRQPFDVSGTTTENIIAVKTGTVYPDSVVVIGAHYDSISEIPMVKAPGAEDNASGVAAVLHLAEIFADYNTERTIHFICFSGEEEGLYGSQYYVGQLAANGWHVTQSLIMDMIASWDTNYKVIIEGEPPWAGLMSTFETNVNAYAQIASRKDWNSWGSDHVPFQNAGIPCFLAIDWDYGAYAHYHRSTDEWAHTDASLGMRITKAMGATLADLSMPSPIATPTPAAPASLRLEQNLPNPFNPSTRIQYSLDRSGPVRVEVFDSAGRRVATLVDTVQPEGTHFVDWQGRDSEGHRVASGMYHYRLVTDAGTLTRRMILAK